MRIKILLRIILFSLLAIINCKKNSSPLVSEGTIQPKQLTSTGLDYGCFWAPNGEYIAFLSARNTYNPYSSVIIRELWIMDKDGSNQRSLISVDELYKTTDVTSVSWAQNSDNMLVHFHVLSIPNKSEIWRITTNGDKIRLSSSNDWAEQPLYSPDGTKTAFIIQGPNPPDGSPIYRLYVANADFSDTLLIEKGCISDYEWKSNSQGLIYSLFDRPQKNYDLWEASTNGVYKLRISETPENEETISCSYDGKYIAYSDYNAVYITPTNKFNPKLIIEDARLPQWIPNRNFILLLSEQTLDNNKFWTESWIVDLHGNVIKKIAVGEASWTAFSSTGDYYAYSVNGNIWLDYLPY